MHLTELKPYRVHIRDEAHARPLTEFKWRELNRWLHEGKPSSYFDLHDDDGNYEITLAKKDIVDLYRAKTTTTGSVTYRCGYGTRHDQNTSCECSSRFQGMPWDIFQHTLRAGGFALKTDGFLGNQLLNGTTAMHEYVTNWIQKTGYQFVPHSLPDFDLKTV